MLLGSFRARRPKRRAPDILPKIREGGDHRWRQQADRYPGVQVPAKQSETELRQSDGGTRGHQDRASVDGPTEQRLVLSQRND